MDHVMDFIYDNNGAPYATKYDGTEYYYVLNLQGDVIRIIDTTGASAAEYIYDAWGRPVSATGTMAEVNPIRYRGYYFDSDSGLYYLQSRYYDPVVKRFINADTYASTGQGFLGINMFAYCENSPISRVDPTGHYEEWVYRYFGTEWAYEQFCRQYGYGKQVAELSNMGIPEYAYHVPSYAKNVSISIQSSTVTRTLGDTIGDYAPGLLLDGALAVAGSMFVPMYVSIVGSVIIDGIGRFVKSDPIATPGEYTAYTVIIEFDKADEISGRMIHFYQENTFLQVGRFDFYCDSTDYLSYPVMQ